MKRRLFEDREHLIRVAGLFIAGLVVFLGIQSLFVPRGFGLYGHYRSGALEDIKARPPHYAGAAACLDCHSDVGEAKTAGKHSGISCEACHGALAGHAANPDSLKPERPNPRTLCLQCHLAEAARPDWFPQVNPAEHGDEGSCTACHISHNPGSPPEVTP